MSLKRVIHSDQGDLGVYSGLLGFKVPLPEGGFTYRFDGYILRKGNVIVQLAEPISVRSPTTKELNGMTIKKENSQMQIEVNPDNTPYSLEIEKRGQHYMFYERNPADKVAMEEAMKLYNQYLKEIQDIQAQGVSDLLK